MRRASLCAATAVLVLGAIVVLQVQSGRPAAASGSVYDTLYSWGSTPVLQQSLPDSATPTAVTADFSDTYVIGSDGNVYAWGTSYDGELGDGTTTTSTTPVEVSLPAGVSATAVAVGNSGPADSGTAYAIGSDGNLYAWGYNGDGELGDGTTTGPDSCSNGGTVACSTTPVKVALPAGVTPVAVAAASSSAYAIGSNGKLYAWGYNGDGELGDGTTTGSDTPAVVSLPAGVTPIAIAGPDDSDAYAIGSDGNLYAWGGNLYGELGDGANTGPDQCPSVFTIGSNQITVNYPCSTVPAKVSLPSGVSPTAIAGGEYGGYAVGSDDNLYAWGLNENGTLGDGTNTGPDMCTVPELVGTSEEPCSTSPIKVLLPSGATPTAVALNRLGGSALASNGDVYAWGAGDLGDGSTGASYTPVVVSLPTGSAPVTLGQDPAAPSYAVVSRSSVKPAVTTDPLNQSVYAGYAATFSAGASGIPTPSVKWQVSVDDGATWVNTSLTTTTISGVPSPLLNGWEFRAVFTNVAGSATTTAATLSILPDVAPQITIQPTNQSVPLGEPVTFSAAASGAPTPAVQWQVSVDKGATWINASLTTPTITGVPTALLNGWEFRAVFINGGGSATTNAATLTLT